MDQASKHFSLKREIQKKLSETTNTINQIIIINLRKEDYSYLEYFGSSENTISDYCMFFPTATGFWDVAVQTVPNKLWLKTTRSAHMPYNTTSLNLLNSFAKILWNYDVSTLPDAKRLATFIHKNTSCEVKYSAKPSNTACSKTTTRKTCRTPCPLNLANHHPHFENNEKLITSLQTWGYYLLVSWEKAAGVYL